MKVNSRSGGQDLPTNRYSPLAHRCKLMPQATPLDAFLDTTCEKICASDSMRDARVRSLQKAETLFPDLLREWSRMSEPTEEGRTGGPLSAAPPAMSEPTTGVEGAGSSSWPRVGDHAVLRGIVSKPHLNEQRVRIEEVPSATSERYMVRVIKNPNEPPVKVLREKLTVVASSTTSEEDHNKSSTGGGEQESNRGEKKQGGGPLVFCETLKKGRMRHVILAEGALEGVEEGGSSSHHQHLLMEVVEDAVGTRRKGYTKNRELVRVDLTKLRLVTPQTVLPTLAEQKREVKDQMRAHFLVGDEVLIKRPPTPVADAHAGWASLRADLFVDNQHEDPTGKTGIIIDDAPTPEGLRLFVKVGKQEHGSFLADDLKLLKRGKGKREEIPPHLEKSLRSSARARTILEEITQGGANASRLTRPENVTALQAFMKDDELCTWCFPGPRERARFRGLAEMTKHPKWRSFRDLLYEDGPKGESRARPLEEESLQKILRESAFRSFWRELVAHAWFLPRHGMGDKIEKLMRWHDARDRGETLPADEEPVRVFTQGGGGNVPFEVMSKAEAAALVALCRKEDGGVKVLDLAGVDNMGDNREPPSPSRSTTSKTTSRQNNLSFEPTQQSLIAAMARREAGVGVDFPQDELDRLQATNWSPAYMRELSDSVPAVANPMKNSVFSVVSGSGRATLQEIQEEIQQGEDGESGEDDVDQSWTTELDPEARRVFDYDVAHPSGTLKSCSDNIGLSKDKVLRYPVFPRRCPSNRKS